MISVVKTWRMSQMNYFLKCLCLQSSRGAASIHRAAENDSYWKLGFRQIRFSETGLAVLEVAKATTDRYTPLGRCRLRQALSSSLKLATKAIKKMSAGKAKNMMASQYVSTVKLM